MTASAAQIAAAVVAGRLSPVDVLREHVARYRDTESLKALAQPRHEAAGIEARAVASLLAKGGKAAAWRLPLAGVPVSVKECFPVAGLVTSLGIPSRSGVHDTVDADIVSWLKAAGALVVGKSNVSQAMYLHEADNPVWGRTTHPFNPRRGPGGSSGGDAALVAAGVVPLAVGTDLAGSIRQPAHACGIAGLVPRQAVFGEGGAVDTVPHLETVRPRVGFLAGHVDDLELALVALSQDSGSLRQEATHASRLRIAWWDDAGPLEPSAAIRRAVHEAVNRLVQAGAEVVQMSGDLAAEAAWLHLAILSADGGADIRRLFGGTRPIPPVARLLGIAGCPGWLRAVIAAAADLAGCRIEAEALRATGPRTPAALATLFDRRAALAVRCAELLAGCDAVVCPVSALPALPHGTAAKLVVAAAPCMLANLLDLAAGAVPVTRVRPEEEGRRAAGYRGRDRVVRAAVQADRGSEGLPVGVQVIALGTDRAAADGPLAAERMVLEVMRLIETGGRNGPGSSRSSSGVGYTSGSSLAPPRPAVDLIDELINELGDEEPEESAIDPADDVPREPEATAMAPLDDEIPEDQEPFFERFSTERIVRLVTEKEDIHDFRPILRPPVPVLTVLDDGSLEHGEEFRLRRDRLAIGRTSGEVQIPNDASISRAHAEIRRLTVEGGGYRWQLHDLNSVNGTFVRCLKAPLHPQTIVILGGRRYQLKNPLNSFPVLAGASTDTSLVDGRNLPEMPWPMFVEKTAKPGAVEILLESDKYLLGRMGGGADIEIDDPLLANKHAILRRQRDGSWMIQAQATRNGLWVSTTAVDLTPHCFFRCGEQRFRFLIP